MLLCISDDDHGFVLSKDGLEVRKESARVEEVEGAAALYAQIKNEPDVQVLEESKEKKEQPEHRIKTTVPNIVKMIRKKVNARIALATQIAILGSFIKAIHRSIN